MGNGIYTALAGAVAQGNALDVTANNVANASTSGYRAERVSFHETLTQAKGNDQAYVTAAGGGTDLRPGEMRATENPLDLAVVGDGYFAVQTPRGDRYTRAGNFRLDASGTLVNGDGYAARAKGGGVLTVPPESKAIVVGSDGTVEADGIAVGQLELARFVPGALQREGDTLFSARAGAAPLAEGAGGEVEVASGALEGANFNVVRGVVDLVRISRTYEALHSMIESYKDIDARTARDIGGPK
jgi:flagellar basal-body rod protein FlgF